MKVDPNTTIVVDICGDGEEITIPDVDGYTRDRAVKALEDLGFTVDVTEAFDDNVTAGNVISITPKAGGKTSRGSVIRMVVSKGKQEENEEATVPDIRNLTEAEAKSELTKAGLKSGTARSAFSDTVEEGRIISQSIEKGKKVPKDTAVSYEVSKGKEIKDCLLYTSDAADD